MNTALQPDLFIISCHTAGFGAQVRMIVRSKENGRDGILLGYCTEETTHKEFFLRIND